MSTNKSQNLKLHLWEPEDNFLRTEFNENFAAIDTAIDAAAKAEAEARNAAIQEVKRSISSTGSSSSSAVSSLRTELTREINAAKTAAENAQTTANAAQTTANAAWSKSNPFFAAGSRRGTGSNDSGSRSYSINIGFRPSMFMMSGPSVCAVAYRKDDNVGSLGNASVQFTSTGVTISASNPSHAFDYNNYNYQYIAFR
ncbi:MAG: hypothetical protein HFF18_11460 [Oscillospiraceae bacterium]|nr:hypothetical protein [Oscillospiraceae bacterium]